MAEFISVALVVSVVIVIAYILSAVVYVKHDKSNTFEAWEDRRFRELEVTDESEKDLYRDTFEWSWIRLKYSLRELVLTVGKIVEENIKDRFI